MHAMSSLLLSAHVTTFCSLHNGRQYVVVVVVYCLFASLFLCLKKRESETRMTARAPFHFSSFFHRLIFGLSFCSLIKGTIPILLLLLLLLFCFCFLGGRGGLLFSVISLINMTYCSNTILVPRDPAEKKL